MHQIELRCVAYGYPGVSIYWMKASDGDTLNNEEFIFDNEGKTKKVINVKNANLLPPGDQYCLFSHNSLQINQTKNPRNSSELRRSFYDFLFF